VTPDTIEDEKQEPEHSGQDLTKVGEEFQQKLEELIGEATLPELDFVISEATEMKKKMNKSQNKAGLNLADFSSEGMPQ
jgi:hypothetical protein